MTATESEVLGAVAGATGIALGMSLAWAVKRFVLAVEPSICRLAELIRARGVGGRPSTFDQPHES